MSFFRPTTSTIFNHKLLSPSLHIPSHPFSTAMPRGLYSWEGKIKTLEVVDCHAGGEPARVVVEGLPDFKGQTVYKKRQDVIANYDAIRKLLLHEPRGYPCQNANLIVPSDKAAAGVIFMEQNKIYPMMSGHNLICVATTLLETSRVAMIEPVSKFQVETPGGVIDITASVEKNKVNKISFKNMKTFVEALDVTVDVPTVGKVKVDIIFSGMWYAVVNAADVGIDILGKHGKKIVRIGEIIKRATREQFPVKHPELDYEGVDILVFRAPPRSGSTAHGLNTVVMSNNEFSWSDPDTWTGMLDRSPCGTGTSAVMASLWARGQLKQGQEFVHEGILGSKFQGKILEECSAVGSDGKERKAMIPEISGSAWITQFCTVKLHPSDPFPEGFTVGDIWG